MIDQCGTAMGDMAEARDHAVLIVRSLIMAPGTEDWRDWVLHVSDGSGDEILAMPFIAVLGQLH
jgi:hypothetical protein